MDLRAGVNRVVRRASGYQVVRASTPAAEAAPAPPRPRRRPPVRPDPSAEPGAPARERGLPPDYDEETREIWELVRDRTMTRHPKIQFLVEAVRYVERCRIPGAVVECGVWRGGSMLTVAHTLSRRGATDRDLYLFDTFTGMTAPTERDVRISGRHAEEYLTAEDPDGPLSWTRPGRFVATLDDVKAGFATVDYPADRLHFVPGRVEDTVPEHAPAEIALLRLDTDWYESTRHELRHLYPRLVPGGALIIDDYGTWQGSKEATDEFLEETGEPLLLTRVSRARVAVKPGLRSTVSRPSGSAGSDPLG